MPPPANDRPQKITAAGVRAQGVRGLLIYCADYRCSHSIAISGRPLELRECVADILAGENWKCPAICERGIARRDPHRGVGDAAHASLHLP
jgi:hypothetical protein